MAKPEGEMAREKRKARVAALRGPGAPPLAQYREVASATAAGPDMSKRRRFPLALRSEKGMPLGIGFVYSGELVAYVEISSDDLSRACDVDAAAGAWFLCPTTEASRVHILSSAPAVSSGTLTPAPTRSDFWDALVAYGEMLRDARLIVRMAELAGTASQAVRTLRSVACSRWLARLPTTASPAFLMGAARRWLLLAVDAEAPWRRDWVSLEAEICRTLSNSGSSTLYADMVAQVGERPLDVSTFLEAVAVGQPRSSHAYWLGLVVDRTERHPRFRQDDLVMRLVVAPWRWATCVFAPLEARARTAGHLARASLLGVVGVPVADVLDSLELPAAALAQTALRTIIAKEAPLTHASSVRRADVLAAIGTDLMARDDRHMAAFLPLDPSLADGTAITAIEELPPCLARVARHGRTTGHLKHVDRFQAAAQMQVLGVHDPEVVYALFMGGPYRPGVGDSVVWAQMKQELKRSAAGRSYAFGCTRIFYEGKIMSEGNVLACCEGGKVACAAGAGLDPESFSSPAAHVVEVRRRRRQQQPKQ